MSDSAYDALVEASGEAVSRETYDLLLRYQELLRTWSRRINLVAPSTLPHIWSRHILDSARLFSLVPQAQEWLDLGSGAGFPGMVLAILAAGRGSSSGHHLMESNGKKCAFLRSVASETGAPAKVHHARIEESYMRIDTPDVITARALAPLPQLLGLAAPWLQAGAVAYFHKGRDFAAEVAESRYQWNLDLIEHRLGGDAGGVILEIRNLQRRD